ncbi:aconitate hydratase AcnA [Agaricicola taiwanensis]|nr:aconitate hydratase AcnA [Agaricicola taiwanensis]
MRLTRESLQVTRRPFAAPGNSGHFWSLPTLAGLGYAGIARMPRSLRVILEALLRHAATEDASLDSLDALARWQPQEKRETEMPFYAGRLVLQDIAGIPLLGDMAAMRAHFARTGREPDALAPRIPVSMVIDHTLAVDHHGHPDASERNLEIEIARNEERFRFVKWAMQAMPGIEIVPPGFGILHQINLERFSRGILSRNGDVFPDSLVGTDSHTCMITGLGVLGWGVGGIEAQAAILGEPVVLRAPEVTGVDVAGILQDGVTATDLVLHVTNWLRQNKVVGEFVEFFGEGLNELSVPDRATIANMAPEYGATVGFFPVDQRTLAYMRMTGRSPEEVAAVEAYYRAQDCFGVPKPGDVDYSRVLTLNLSEIEPVVAGPKRPQDKVPLRQLKPTVAEAISRPPVKTMGLSDGSLVIAAITSCTNTSNPEVMIAAGLLAKNAVAKGLSARPWVKTSLAPGSRAVSGYLEASGLQRHLDRLGFSLIGFGCTTCIGNSGPLLPEVESTLETSELVVAAALSGNRNFEGRIHPKVKLGFLMSPPLVVAMALAGRADIDLEKEPLGTSSDGQPVFLRDIWPSRRDIEAMISEWVTPARYADAYDQMAKEVSPLWKRIEAPKGDLFSWDPASTNLKEPPFLDEPFRRSALTHIVDARPLALFGDSITTDHISPVGVIAASSPAGKYLASFGVAPKDFVNYGARRMNHDVMVRGGFSNARLRNLMVGAGGGITAHQPSGEVMSIFEAAERYAAEKVPLVILAGAEYGTGSARDWAAKVTRLLGVRAVIASSFERIHRTNLVGMGVLPFVLPAGVSAVSLALAGTETFTIGGIREDLAPGVELELCIRSSRGEDRIPVRLQIETDREILYARAGGIMPFLVR